jgi:hypothetical protein
MLDAKVIEKAFGSGEQNNYGFQNLLSVCNYN